MLVLKHSDCGMSCGGCSRRNEAGPAVIKRRFIRSSPGHWRDSLDLIEVAPTRSWTERDCGSVGEKEREKKLLSYWLLVRAGP